MGSGSSRQQEERALSPFGVQDGVEPWIPPDSRLSGSIDGYGFGNSTITHTTESIPKRHSRNRSDPGYHTDVMSSSNSNSTGSDKKKQVINITIDMNKINRRFSSDSEPEVNVVMKSGGSRSHDNTRTSQKVSSRRSRSRKSSKLSGERPESERIETPRNETPSPVHSSRSDQILPTESPRDEWPNIDRSESDLRQSTGIVDYTDDDAYSSLHEHGYTEEEHEAATKIQAHFRGFLARKRLQKNDPPKRRKQKNHEKLDVDSSARGTSRSLTLSNNSDEQKKPKRSKSKAKNDAVVRRSRSDTNLEEKNRQQSKARSKSKSKPPALLERSSGANSKNSKSVASSVPSKNTSRPPGKEIRVVAPKGKEGIAPRS
uniref:Uncharacterized protein n=1 Tax=Plectus sambesii TaxID=2011161 RepID=A0A914WHV6_9BILA